MPPLLQLVSWKTIRVVSATMAGYRPRSLQVTLHIYDLLDLNRYGHPVGLGAFHSGVEVGGLEFSFGGIFFPCLKKGHESDSSGIFTVNPKEAPGVLYRYHHFDI